jgi:hypothetical protein
MVPLLPTAIKELFPYVIEVRYQKLGDFANFQVFPPSQDTIILLPTATKVLLTYAIERKFS